MSQPLCIDTALVHHHLRGRPLEPGLAWLTKKRCQRDMQTRRGRTRPPGRQDASLRRSASTRNPIRCGIRRVQDRPRAHLSTWRGRAAWMGGTAVVGHGHPGVMHGFKATTATCRLRGARRPDPSGPRTDSSLGGLRGICGRHGLLVCIALVGGLGLVFFSVRVDAESDGGCSRRGGPSDRGVARSPRNCTSHVGRATPHALHVPAALHRRGDLYRSLKSEPHHRR